MGKVQEDSTNDFSFGGFDIFMEGLHLVISEHLQELNPVALFFLETYFPQNWNKGDFCSLA